MKLKASLHLHTAEDPIDGKLVGYDFLFLIDRAAELGFKVLALTCHHHFVYSEKFIRRAKQKSILLLSGIELQLDAGWRQPHVVVLNCQADIAKVKTLEQLREYKNNHPEIFVLAPHPNSDIFHSLGSRLFKANADVFDGLEHTWFYSKFFNSNKVVARLAKEFEKPLIATADLHDIKYLAGDYTIIEADKFETKKVIEALKAGKVKNYSSPKSLYKMFAFVARFWLLQQFYKFFKK
jgi:predicted metal-dependent phosphoesterase TrpH